MSQKYLYIVDHFIPAPQSSDGGIWNVIAKNDEECFDLISSCFLFTKEDNDLNIKYYPRLKENIVKAQKFVLKDDYESEVIEAFLT